MLSDTDFFLPSNTDHDSIRLRASEIDDLMGFKISDIEENLLKKARLLNPTGNVQTYGQGLHEGNQTWIGLDYQTLQTPYAELWEMMELLPSPPLHVVDLGAGYGRMALVLHKRDPSIRFTGYELVGQRVKEGQRVIKNLGINADLREQNLMAADFELPVADVYFLYDFGKLAHIRIIMEKLSKIADSHSFQMIARGKGSRGLIDLEFPWLTRKSHREFFSIYSMNP